MNNEENRLAEKYAMVRSFQRKAQSIINANIKKARAQVIKNLAKNVNVDHLKLAQAREFHRQENFSNLIETYQALDPSGQGALNFGAGDYEGGAVSESSDGQANYTKHEMQNYANLRVTKGFEWEAIDGSQGNPGSDYDSEMEEALVQQNQAKNSRVKIISDFEVFDKKSKNYYADDIQVDENALA